MAVRVDPPRRSPRGRRSAVVMFFAAGTAATPAPPSGRRDSRPRHHRPAVDRPPALPPSPNRRQISTLVSGMAGPMSRATIRSTSKALPRTASTAGPGSAFHGSCVSRWAFASWMSRHVASRATWGWARSHATRRFGENVGGQGGQRTGRIGRRTDAAALRSHHRRHPGHQVPQVVGQIGVVAGGDTLIGEVPVGSEGGVSQQVVPEGVEPVLQPPDRPA